MITVSSPHTEAEEEMKSITLQDVIDRYEEKTAHLGSSSF